MHIDTLFPDNIITSLIPFNYFLILELAPEERWYILKHNFVLPKLFEGNFSKYLKGSIKNHTQDNSARSFAKLMWEGKTQAAHKMLSKEYKNGVVNIEDDILTELKSNNPPTADVKQDSLLFDPINELSHCYFHEIDKIMIAKAASLTKGVGGPFHLNADQFRHILLSKKFKTEPKKLRVQIAVLARILASTTVDPTSIKALAS